ncbi:hypothetical protein [Treponema sp. R6D11]
MLNNGAGQKLYENHSQAQKTKNSLEVSSLPKYADLSSVGLGRYVVYENVLFDIARRSTTEDDIDAQTPYGDYYKFVFPCLTDDQAYPVYVVNDVHVFFVSGSANANYEGYELETPFSLNDVWVKNYSKSAEEKRLFVLYDSFVLSQSVLSKTEHFFIKGKELKSLIKNECQP